MKKKAYIKPEMEIVELRQAVTLMYISPGKEDMEEELQDEEVDEGW